SRKPKHSRKPLSIGRKRVRRGSSPDVQCVVPSLAAATRARYADTGVASRPRGNCRAVPRLRRGVLHGTRKRLSMAALPEVRLAAEERQAMIDLFNTPHPQDGGPHFGELTLATLERWLNELPSPDPVCGVDRLHVVHPASKGWARCGNCFGPVW